MLLTPDKKSLNVSIVSFFGRLKNIFISSFFHSLYKRNLCKKIIISQFLRDLQVHWLAIKLLFFLVAFKMYDLDNDDRISKDELLAVLHMMVGANIGYV